MCRESGFPFVFVINVAWDGRMDGLCQSASYLHKAGRTAGTLQLGARYRPLWLRSLHKGKNQTGELFRYLFHFFNKHNQFTNRAMPNGQAAAAFPHSSVPLKVNPAFHWQQQKQQWNAAVL